MVQQPIRPITLQRNTRFRSDTDYCEDFVVAGLSLPNGVVIFRYKRPGALKFDDSLEEVYEVVPTRKLSAKARKAADAAKTGSHQTMGSIIDSTD